MQSGAVASVCTTQPAAEKMLNPHKPLVNKKYNDQCGQKLKRGRMGDEMVGDKMSQNQQTECLFAN